MTTNAAAAETRISGMSLSEWCAYWAKGNNAWIGDGLTTSEMRDDLEAASAIISTQVFEYEQAERERDAFPDLLAACQRTLEILDSWGPERRGHTLELLHGRVSAAIAKATGQPLPAPPSGGNGGHLE